MFLEPLFKHFCDRRAAVLARFVAGHLVENHGPKFGDALDETAVTRCLQAAHHGSTAISMNDQQILDQIVLAPGSELIAQAMRVSRQLAARPDDKRSVS